MIKLLLIWNWWSPVTSSTRTYTSVAITHILKVRFAGRFSELNWTKRYFFTKLSYDLFIDNDESCKSQPSRHVFHELGYKLHTVVFVTLPWSKRTYDRFDDKLWDLTWYEKHRKLFRNESEILYIKLGKLGDTFYVAQVANCLKFSFLK